MSTPITVRGIREGVLITLGGAEVPDLLTRLEELVDGREAFFRGGKVAFQVDDLRLAADEISRLCQVFEQRGVAVWAVIGTDPVTRAAVRQLELADSFPPPEAPEASEAAPIPELAFGTGILVPRTLRSGQNITHVGHVVIMGDVNAGAEVVAGGDIFVWGHLRGTVHAGAMGDEERSVCALDLSPTQLRIGNHIARPPEGKRRVREIRPERAYVSNGQIVAERWK